MANQPEMRASDEDRDDAVDRLRDAHIDGRLSTDEFKERLDAAYGAHTHGELEELFRDLPRVRRTRTTPSTPVLARQPAAPVPRRRTGGDRAMRVLWTIWTCAVSVNLVVWLLVTMSTGDPGYFWPMWVAGPSGAILASIEVMRRVG